MTSEWGGLWRDNALDSVCCTKLDVLPSSLNRCGDKSWVKKTKKNQKQKRRTMNFCKLKLSEVQLPSTSRLTLMLLKICYEILKNNNKQTTKHYLLGLMRAFPLPRSFIEDVLMNIWSSRATDSTPLALQNGKKNGGGGFQSSVCRKETMCACVCMCVCVCVCVPVSATER